MGGTSTRVDHGWATARGSRSENQDRAATAVGWLAVSDGIGGHAGGALAADLTIAAVAELLDRPDVAATVPAATRAVDALRLANASVRRRRAADPAVAEMGATIALAVSASTGSRWAVLGLGDSPAWVVRADGARQLTTDDNLAGELARTGTITAADAEHHPGRHLLLRAVGLEEEATVDVAEVDLHGGDALVLASDGLSGVLGPTDIHHAVAIAPSMAAATAALVELAIRAGTRDNVTVAAVRLVAG